MHGGNQLEGLELFQDVRPEIRDRLWKDGKVEGYVRNRMIIRAREPVGAVFIQLSGKSVVYNLTHMGKRKILFVFGKGMLLNEHVMNWHTASLYCETIEKSRIFTVPSSKFIHYMEQDFELAKSVLVAQEKKIWRLGHQLKNTMGSVYMERKLAAKLWKLGRDFGIQTPEGIEIDVKLTVTFLADMLGAPRETASRLCKTLTGYGLIRMDKKRITILDPHKMSVFYKTGKVE